MISQLTKCFSVTRWKSLAETWAAVGRQGNSTFPSANSLKGPSHQIRSDRKLDNILGLGRTCGTGLPNKLFIPFNFYWVFEVLKQPILNADLFSLTE
jgi:hypothetical protein